jgi:predicted nucleic acid-binding protein
MLILADTSVWINHLRKRNCLFAGFLEESAVLMHPCVLGELALGNLRQRAEILRFLGGGRELAGSTRIYWLRLYSPPLAASGRSTCR